MSTQSKAPLRASERKEQQRLKQRRQANIRALVLVIIIVIACFVDLIFINKGIDGPLDDNFVVSKSVALGAALNWLAQTIFTKFVFKYTGANAKHNIVGQLYLGQIIKWVVVVVGFSLIFMTVKSISAPSLIIGFVLMQIGHFILLFKSR